MSVPVPGRGVCVNRGFWGVSPPKCVPHPAVSNGPTEVTSLEGGPLAWKEGRQLLRQ